MNRRFMELAMMGAILQTMNVTGEPTVRPKRPSVPEEPPAPKTPDWKRVVEKNYRKGLKQYWIHPETGEAIENDPDEVMESSLFGQLVWARDTKNAKRKYLNACKPTEPKP